MNVLFISISSLPHISEHSISLDLIHEFKRHGHEVYIVCALEKRENLNTYLTEEAGCHVLRVKIGNNKNTGIIEKGITTLSVPHKYISAIKHYYSNIKFDLILYPTPPITFRKAVEYVKKRDGAKSYLMLKDIFPQNAVDIGMMKTSGVKGAFYRYFRREEKRLYSISDWIGCMSPANVQYLLKHNTEIHPQKVEVCPNSIEVIDKSIDDETRNEIRKKYGIPTEKKVFVYGGNLGKPQGIPFLIKCLDETKENTDAMFLIIGSGTEYSLLEEYESATGQNDHFRLMSRLPKEDYDTLVAACDVGLIFLDHRFTIPNFPSRLLSYMQAKLPVLAVTDPNTDIGKIIVDKGFGWWCESNDATVFSRMVKRIIEELPHHQNGSSEFAYLKKNFNVESSYNMIVNKIHG